MRNLKLRSSLLGYPADLRVSFFGSCILRDGATGAGAFANLLRECGSAKDLARGKCAHEQIVVAGLASDRFLCNLLVEMYGKCGSVDDARAVFGRIGERNVYSWNIMLAAYAQNGHCESALRCFRKMDLEGVKPTHVTIVSVIASCAELGSVKEARMVHSRVEACGLGAHIVAGSALINMYGKCGCLEDAKDVFEKLPAKNVVSWTSMIRAYALSGENREALETYKRMQVAPNEYTFACVAEACGKGGTLVEARQIHAQIYEAGIGTSSVVGTAVVGMYCKLGSLDEARALFEKQHSRNLFCRNTLIAAYIQKGHVTEGLELYRQMEVDRVQPDRVTFLEVLAACSDGTHGKSLHASIVKYGFDEDDIVCHALVTMYGKCGSLEVARSLFERICYRNVVSWTTMIAAYAQNGQSKEALQLYHGMDLEGIRPNELTFVSVLDACSSSWKNLAAGGAIHDRILETGIRVDGILGNALIDMYGKCGSPETACRIFDAMSTKSVVAWTAMIAAYCQSGYWDEAFEIYDQLRSSSLKPTCITFVNILEACSGSLDLEHGNRIHQSIIESGFETDVFVGTALISMYGTCGCLEAARGAFDSISEKNVVSWNAMMAVYVQNGSPSEAIGLFNSMDVEADKVSFVSALDACAALADINTGRIIHQSLSDSSYLSDVCVRNSLLKMYASCGNLIQAKALFDETQVKNLVTWNEMALALATLGHAQESLNLLAEMELRGFKPDANSLTGLLSACSHAGLKQHGRQLFNSMKNDHGVAQNCGHYVCIADLLGRLGQLDEAEELLNNMPFEPGHIAWMTLLGSCSTHGDLMRASSAAWKALLLNERYTGAYVILSNIYAGTVGMFSNAKKDFSWCSLGDAVADTIVDEPPVGLEPATQMKERFAIESSVVL